MANGLAPTSASPSRNGRVSAVKSRPKSYNTSLCTGSIDYLGYLGVTSLTDYKFLVLEKVIVGLYRTNGWC